MHSPTPTHTHSHRPTLSQKKSHSPTPTHTQPKKGHTHPHLPTPSQKRSYPTIKRHGHLRITERKNVMCLTHTLKYSIFTILAGVFKIYQFIFFYWIPLKRHLNLLFVCLFSTISKRHIKTFKGKVVRNMWNIFVFFHYVLLLLYKIIKHIMCSSQGSTLVAKITQSSKRGWKKTVRCTKRWSQSVKMSDKWYVIFYMSIIVYGSSWLVICPILYRNANCPASHFAKISCNYICITAVGTESSHR